MVKKWLCDWLDVKLVVLLIGLVTLTGCSSNAFETFTLEEGIGHFTFEYPERYEVEKVETRSDLGYTHVILSGSVSNPEKGGIDYTFIGVFIEETSAYFPSAEVTLETSLAEASQHLPDYQLLEQSTLSVAGVEGQQIVYYYDRGVYYPEEPVQEPIPTVMRKVYFDHSGLIWSISIRSNQAAAETAQADFEHLLETFQILGVEEE
jgi:hypothetical protein